MVDVVRIHRLEVIGPGPGTLIVKFSEMSLYDEPFVSFISPKGFLYGTTMVEGEPIVMGANQYQGKTKDNPPKVTLTQEQQDWLKDLEISKIAKKFREMEALLDITVLKE
jgi:hypothetical protein